MRLDVLSRLASKRRILCLFLFQNSFYWFTSPNGLNLLIDLKKYSNDFKKMTQQYQINQICSKTVVLRNILSLLFFIEASPGKEAFNFM